ncbi:hypothetical protein [Acidovorax sp. SUPP3334]|nr:hypothetical protein [Acidovorax sp. SUPP3334]GKT21686.1 hypothetical protein AVHM3334_05650 [Acidovorax sp. SUPP3334]
MTNNAEKAVQMGVVQGNVTVVNVIHFPPHVTMNCASCQALKNRLEALEK